MASACDIFAQFCVAGIEADAQRCLRNVHNSTATITALIERIGYEAAEQLAESVAAAAGDPLQTIRRFVVERNLLSVEEFEELTSPDA